VDLVVVVSLVISLAIILLSCEVFTNGIEWLGHRLGLADTATGSILAAVGTAMPETIIPLMAIFFGTEEQGEKIGEGAILGAPFMLSTLAMFVGGVTVWYAYRRGRREPRLKLRASHATRDLKYFIMMYSMALIAGIIGTTAIEDVGFDNTILNVGIAAVLLLVYGFYFHRTMSDECEKKENTCPLFYCKRLFGIDPEYGALGFTFIVLQVLAALMGIIIGAKFFVDGVEEVSLTLGVPAIFLAFVIAPVATELPEKFNSVLWYLRGKDTLAFGNITGAMVFQSSIPVSIGLLFTDWSLEPINIASIVMAMVAASWLYYEVGRGSISFKVMLASGSFYALYIVVLFGFVLS
jgi:cation:H+ antiporter